MFHVFCVTSSRLRQEITILGIVVLGATKGSSDLFGGG